MNVTDADAGTSMVDMTDEEHRLGRCLRRACRISVHFAGAPVRRHPVAAPSSLRCWSRAATTPMCRPQERESLSALHVARMFVALKLLQERTK
jgi:hypothetical protein